MLPDCSNQLSSTGKQSLIILNTTKLKVIYLFIKALKMPFIKWDGGRSQQFLNNISETDEPIQKIVSKKRTSTQGNTRAKFDSIRFDDVITRAKKDDVFFCPSVTFFLGYSSFISLVDHGREISGLLTPIEWRSFFLNFGWKWENLKKK